MTPTAPRPVRRYVVHRHAVYTLRDAARAADVPLGRLRRDVVLGDVPSEPVDDDREYLVTGQALQSFILRIRPGEQADFRDAEDVDWGIGVFLAFPLIAFLVCAAGLASAPPPEMVPTPPTEQVEIRESPPRPPRTPGGPWNWFIDHPK